MEELQKNSCEAGQNVNKKRKRSPRSLLIKHLREFGDNTSLHGLRYVIDRRLSVVEKIFWLVTFLVSVSLCFYWITSIWARWRDNPVIVTFKESLEPVWKVSFPSVTICPQIKFKATEFNYTGFITKRFDNIYKGYNEDEVTDKYIEEQRLGQNLGYFCQEESSYPSQIFTDITLVNDIVKLSPTIEEVFWECLWNEELIPCNNIFKSVLTEEGNCFNMNSLPAADILRYDRMHQTYNLMDAHDEEAIRGWKEESYYDPDENNPYPRLGSDEIINLQITFIERQAHRDQMCNSINTGFKVYIHQPQDMPRSSIAYYPVTPNMKSLFALKFNKIDSSKNLQSTSPSIRQCYFPKERPLRYFKVYTASNCQLECLTNRTYEFCGCVFMYMPHFTAEKLCSRKRMKCMGQVRKSLVNQICGCLPSCNSVNYEADIVKTDYKMKESLNAASGIFDGHECFNIIKNTTFSSLEMYYKQPRYLSMRRSLLFGTTEFLSNCGGLLGLFFGFSFLSLVEIFYFVTLRLYCELKRERDNEKTKTTNKIYLQ